MDTFKFQLGISPRPVRQRVVFHPLLAPFSKRASLAIVQRLEKLLPRNSALPKIRGMLHFYLEGRRKLDEQAWPGCLAGLRENFT